MNPTTKQRPHEEETTTILQEGGGRMRMDRHDHPDNLRHFMGNNLVNSRDFDTRVNALFFQLEWLRNQELILWQTERIEGIQMNHWNQRHTADRLRKLTKKRRWKNLLKP
jgi:hypothetical protein